jgi:hypothetical protein
VFRDGSLDKVAGMVALRDMVRMFFDSMRCFVLYRLLSNIKDWFRGPSYETEWFSFEKISS